MASKTQNQAGHYWIALDFLIAFLLLYALYSVSLLYNKLKSFRTLICTVEQTTLFKGKTMPLQLSKILEYLLSVS